MIDKVEPDEKGQEGDSAGEVDRENDVTVVSGEPVDLTTPHTDDEKDPVR